MHFSHQEGLFCPSFFEKMQKNAIFFAKYLVTSKKSSTFAPHFRRTEIWRVRNEKPRLFSSVGQST